jgi:hypothetical protein
MSLLNRYDELGLLTNANVKGKTSESGWDAYRGDLVLIEGEIADALGRRMPPLTFIKQAALLATEEKLIFISGFIEKLDYLNLFYEKYSADLAEDLVAAFYVENIAKPIQVKLNGVHHVLLPMIEGDGTVWNDLNEELALEKTDFKGQSAQDKVITVYKTVKTDYHPKYPEVSWDEALAQTIEVKKELRGAV